MKTADLILFILNESGYKTHFRKEIGMKGTSIFPLDEKNFCICAGCITSDQAMYRIRHEDGNSFYIEEDFYPFKKEIAKLTDEDCFEKLLAHIKKWNCSVIGVSG